MDLKLQSFDGAKAGKITVSEAMFDREYNEPMVHQVVTAFLAGLEQVRTLRKHARKFVVVVVNLLLKKVVDVHVLVQSEVHFGVLVVLHLQLNRVTTVKK